jgi:hypothetical protein
LRKPRRRGGTEEDLIACISRESEVASASQARARNSRGNEPSECGSEFPILRLSVVWQAVHDETATNFVEAAQAARFKTSFISHVLSQPSFS